jgi:hypothetical protein
VLKIYVFYINEFDEKKFTTRSKDKMTQQARRWGSVGYLYPLPCRVGSTGLTAMSPTRGRAELRRTTGRGRARERERERERSGDRRRRAAAGSERIRAAAGLFTKVARMCGSCEPRQVAWQIKFNAVLFCIFAYACMPPAPSLTYICCLYVSLLACLHAPFRATAQHGSSASLHV